MLQHLCNERGCTPAPNEETNPCGITPKHKFGVQHPLEMWPLLWILPSEIPAIKSAFGNVFVEAGQAIPVCRLGKVTTVVQSLSAFHPGADFSENMCKLGLGDFDPCLSRGWSQQTAHKPLWGVETRGEHDHRRLVSLQNLAKNRK